MPQFPDLSQFLPQLLGGMVVNFEIAFIALVLGLALGGLLSFLSLSGGVLKAIVAMLVGVMRAAPTFVVMFFLLNAIPRGTAITLGELSIGLAPSPLMAVALSLVPYSASYVADNGIEAVMQLRRGSMLGALLFLPNITRAFFVLVMSSSTGAAIGVTEGISVILRAAAPMTSLADKMVLFAIGILCFGLTLQAGFFLMRRLQRRLGRYAVPAG
ncbi:hypothetical protein [Nisaea sp.]|uniref:hypothetical protein n=1 Tax=Nisaea sp. TaxID=2024842 RepID=UPI0032EEFE58